VRSERARAAIIYLAAALFAVALAHRFYRLGGPYFTFPKTVQDHVAPFVFPSRDVILLADRAKDIIPRGATVTALCPSEAPNYDVTLWMTAFGMMPRHRVVPPKVEQEPLPQFVLAVREPFKNEKYQLMTELPEGWIYELKR
jgi:hypothetical protein